MYKPESPLNNKTYKILWKFETLPDPLIPTRRPHLVIMNKKKKEPADNWTLRRVLET